MSNFVFNLDGVEEPTENLKNLQNVMLQIWVDVNVENQPMDSQLTRFGLEMFKGALPSTAQQAEKRRFCLSCLPCGATEKIS